LEHPHVEAVFGRKSVQSKLFKLVPKMAVFQEYKGINMKYSHHYPKRRLLAYFV